MRYSSVFTKSYIDWLLKEYGMQPNEGLILPTRSQQQQGRNLFGDGPYIDAPVAPLGTLSSTSIEDMWPGITWTPVFANVLKAGMVHCVRAGGTVSLTGGTAVITPQWGPAGTSMGASLTTTTGTATIAAWYLAFDTLCQSVGAAGANTKVTGHGVFWGPNAGSGLSISIPFGGTQVSVDSTINGNITIRKTLSATNSFIVQNVYGFFRN